MTSVSCEFTFQYGYISTSNIRHEDKRIRLFTFQYGYISTEGKTIACDFLKLFTFQYGYISTMKI